MAPHQLDRCGVLQLEEEVLVAVPPVAEKHHDVSHQRNLAAIKNPKTQDRTRWDRTGRDRTRWDRMGRDGAGQGTAGESRAGQAKDRLGQVRRNKFVLMMMVCDLTSCFMIRYLQYCMHVKDFGFTQKSMYV